MKKYYYVEAYFKGDKKPHLLGNTAGLYITDNVERAEEHLKNNLGATLKIVEAYEHYKQHFSLYPHLKSDMTKEELYSMIDDELEEGITIII